MTQNPPQSPQATPARLVESASATLSFGKGEHMTQSLGPSWVSAPGPPVRIHLSAARSVGPIRFFGLENLRCFITMVARLDGEGDAITAGRTKGIFSNGSLTANATGLEKVIR